MPRWTRGSREALAEWPAAMAIVKRTLALWKKTVDRFPDEIDSFSNFPTMYCGLVGPDGSLRLYDGKLRFVGPDGAIVADQVNPDDYATYIGEAALPDSYLKAPYYKPAGYPDGIYRAGPLARLNVADRCGTRTPIGNWTSRGRLGRIVQSGFHYHYARLIEIVYALERMHELLDDPAILTTKVRAQAGVNNLEGIGVIEAPRGTLIHHYKVDDNGAMTWANLIVATGHNNLAIGRGVLQVAKRFVDGNKISEGALNRVSALVRAYDPCLSCSTHALGMVPIVMQLLGPDGELLDELGRGRAAALRGATTSRSTPGSSRGGKIDTLRSTARAQGDPAMTKKKLTTAGGAPVPDNQNAMTAGPRGPMLLQDVWFLEKLAHFDREVIPERRMHAKGSGAFGTFTVTHDITKYTKAKIFSAVGKKTDMFVRFSTVAGERGAADAERDIRGFAMKFYTEEGNWDLVGNNTPVFFLRDPLKFPDLNHAVKRDPRTNMRSAKNNWDFWTSLPEALHQVTITMSDRGIPLSYRHMHGFGSHTFSFINAEERALLGQVPLRAPSRASRT